ncbi:hypothetical protein [Porphyromonas sp.]
MLQHHFDAGVLYLEKYDAGGQSLASLPTYIGLTAHISRFVEKRKGAKP